MTQIILNTPHLPGDKRYIVVEEDVYKNEGKCPVCKGEGGFNIGPRTQDHFKCPAESRDFSRSWVCINGSMSSFQSEWVIRECEVIHLSAKWGKFWSPDGVAPIHRETQYHVIWDALTPPKKGYRESDDVGPKRLHETREMAEAEQQYRDDGGAGPHYQSDSRFED